MLGWCNGIEAGWDAGLIHVSVVGGMKIPTYLLARS